MFQTKTFEDNVALFELGYTEALVDIKKYQAAGILTASKSQQIKKALIEIKEFRRLLHLAIVAGDLSTAEGQLAAAILALTAIQTEYIKKAQKGAQ